jgi:hypothetical protein
MDSNPLGEIYNGWLNYNQQVPILSSSGKIDIKSVGIVETPFLMIYR